MFWGEGMVGVHIWRWVRVGAFRDGWVVSFGYGNISAVEVVHGLICRGCKTYV